MIFRVFKWLEIARAEQTELRLLSLTNTEIHAEEEVWRNRIFLKRNSIPNSHKPFKIADMLTISHRNHKTVRFLFVDTGNRQTKMQTKHTHEKQKRSLSPPYISSNHPDQSCSVKRFTNYKIYDLLKRKPPKYTHRHIHNNYTFTRTQMRALSRVRNVREGEAKKKRKKTKTNWICIIKQYYY